MNTEEHLLTCLAEEGSEVIKDVSKSLRFGLDDRNVLNPTGPTNRERVVQELNEFFAVIHLLIDRQVIPENWIDPVVQEAKQKKVMEFLEYARKVGALQTR